MVHRKQKELNKERGRDGAVLESKKNIFYGQNMYTRMIIFCGWMEYILKNILCNK
jgi:hypothetical protein